MATATTMLSFGDAPPKQSRRLCDRVAEAPAHFLPHLQQAVDCFTQKFRCARCQSVTDATSIGALNCRYHPFQHRAFRAHNRTYRAGEPMPSDECNVCNRSHLTFNALGASGHLYTREPLGRAVGCTPIDHCKSIDSMLMHPFAPFPLFLADLFAVGQRPYSGDIGAELASLPHVIVIDEPSQLSLSLSVWPPASPTPVVVPVVDVLDEMRSLFNLDELQQDVRMARMGHEISSLSRIAGSQPNGRKQLMSRLYNSEQQSISFVPFAIVARVQPERMELVDRPDLLNVIADEDLI